ncbi:MAG: AAA family ATPase [Bacteroidales bacterium]|jgi:predicted AAA+ superfamily ATPase|nr:AAA family ATPase [Bacteroidales bacterium]
MEQLSKNFKALLSLTPLDFKRYLYSEVAWSDRMIGLIGPRGVGKTTLILQYIKENLDVNKTLYVQADDIYFANHTLVELAEEFSKNRGKYLFIDEVHKYTGWSQALKSIYDYFPQMNVVFTGSSVLDILKGSADLSRRALMFQMQGLSFREYLFLFHHIKIEPYRLQDILEHKTDNFPVRHPLPLFKDYLRRGYYPFGTDDTLFLHRLNQMIIQTLETDIPMYANMTLSTGKKLGKLLKIISQSVPFKPNFTKIASLLEASRNHIDDYCYFMEQAGLIMQLRDKSEGIGQLGKVDKVYIDNANLIYALAEENPKTGNIRETFFLNQMRVKNKVYRSDKGDFNINNITFEVGGKSKNQDQIKHLKKAYIVKDDIEYGYNNILPLWAFGLNY